MAADGGARRATLVVLTVLLVVAAVAVAGLDLTGRLPGGLVTDPASSPTATRDPRPAPVAGGRGAGRRADGSRPRAGASRGGAGRRPPSPSLGGAASAPSSSTSPPVRCCSTGTPATPRIPASVAKLATAAAVLTALGPEHRLTTRVLAGAGVSDGERGAGRRRRRDPHHRRLPAGRPAATGQPCRPRRPGRRGAVARRPPGDRPGRRRAVHRSRRLAGLAADLPVVRCRLAGQRPVGGRRPGAARLRRARGRPGAGGGPRAGPAAPQPWSRGPPDVTRGSAAANAADVARGRVTDRRRDGRAGAADQRQRRRRGAAAAGGRRQRAAGDLRRAVRRRSLDALASLGVPTDGLVLLDGSGLARGSAVPPQALAGCCCSRPTGPQPGLAALLDGLPVAGFSGTLATAVPRPARRRRPPVCVRAKTGTLTGVSALAGTTSTGGRPVVFVVMSDRVPERARPCRPGTTSTGSPPCSRGAPGAENPGVAGG